MLSLLRQPRQRLPRLLVGGLLATALTGCGAYGTHTTPGHAIVAGAVLGAVAIELAAHDRPREPEYTSTSYYFYGPPPALPPRPAPDADQLPSFNPHAARTALNAIDVSDCRAAGAPAGFGHARVVVNPDGQISKVVIDEPSGMSEAAAKCIGDRLGTATVPPFRGSLVTMGTTFHIP